MSSLWQPTTVLPRASRIRRSPIPTLHRFSPALLNDTAPGGDLNFDGITSDATIAGGVTDDSSITVLRAGFNATLPIDFVNLDVNALLDVDGSFELDLPTLETIFGGPLTDGDHVLQLQAEDEHDNVSTIYRVFFTLDTTSPSAPSAPDLSIATDSGLSTTDNITNVRSPVLEAAAVAGGVLHLLADGQEVASITTQGTVPFVAGPLGEGVNQFTLTVEDAAGNVSPTSATLNVVLDTGTPTKPVFDLSLSSDSAPVGDQQTTFANVSLTGNSGTKRCARAD